ncbi:hypothetical protein [Synechococcus sp. CS-205]|uniref:hypothetical protein n=1 Tax=Synechococcus sp. CS-205 TaxID=2847984 RepID=UPI00223AEC55|nr:hypothetical protein [Synechococcus sp. CS-205]MCT0249617.1 hypothetical protein [Synechococcus sp. CS-205]
MTTKVLTKEDPAVQRLCKKRGISLDPMPTIDSMVVMFLRKHGVDVTPPRGTTAGDALSGAFFGAMGPAASLGGAHLKNQETIAAMQVWTSWKQWALGHADWKEYRNDVERRYEENQALVEELLEDPGFRSACMKEQASQKLNQITGYKTLVAALIAGFLALAGIGHVTGGSKLPTFMFNDSARPYR